MTDATGNSRGEIRFILEDAGPIYYFLYFDITASGLKGVNPQIPINGNFEFGTIGGPSPQIPPGWLNATPSANSMDLQLRSDVTVSVSDQTTVNTDGSPNTGKVAYLQGFRSATDAGGNAVLTKSLIIPASNPGTITIRIKPQGWDSGQNLNLTQYDFMQVRLFNGNNLRLNIVGPELNNYASCPFSPNYNANGGAISSGSPGYGAYNNWDLGSGSNNHTQSMTSTYNRGKEPWITCTASLASVAGQTLTLEIRSTYVLAFRSWFLIDDVEWSVVPATLGTPEAYVTALTPANFNCVEVGGNSASGRLYTKLVGTPFTFDVVALKADGSVETNYVASTSKTVMVELVDGSGSVACGSLSALNPAISQSLSFATGDQGRKTASAITVSKAYANVRCRVTDANQSPSVVGCSTDNFAVRPSNFTVTSNANAAGISNSATPVFKAGAGFSLTAASNATGYDNAPSLDASKISAHAGAAQVGTLAGSFGNANPATGTATGSAFSYSEVGYFNFAPNGVYDDNFTAVDSAVGDCTTDFSNAAVGGKVGCKFGNTVATAYFGCFIPDHFDVTVNKDGTLSAACPSGGFTYTGQSMGYGTTTPSLTIKPMNAITGGSVTQNYVGAFQKLTASGVGITTPTEDGAQIGKYPPTKTKLTASMSTGSLTNSSGTMTYTLATGDKYTYTRDDNALINAYTSNVRLAVASVSDGEVSAAGALPTLSPAGVSLRFGRIALQNAHGSELLDLPMRMQAEYWNGNAWITNAADVCTTGISLSLVDPIATDGLITTELCAWDAGSPGVSGLGCAAAGTLTQQFKQPPMAGDFNLIFKAPGVGNTGALDITAAVPNYLKFNWKGAGDVDPKARASFGVYKGSRRVIYFREVY